MKKAMVLLLLLLIAVFSIPAFADEPAEEIVYRGLSIGIYDVWVHSDGKLQITESQKAKWGESFGREPEYPLPELSKYTLTKVVVKNQNNKFTESEFNQYNDKGYVFADKGQVKGFKTKYLQQLMGKYTFKDETINLTPNQKTVKFKRGKRK
jgi:hypothetical protein